MKLENEYLENLHQQILKLTASQVAETISLLLLAPKTPENKKKLEILRVFFNKRLKLEGWL